MNAEQQKQTEKREKGIEKEREKRRKGVEVLVVVLFDKRENSVKRERKKEEKRKKERKRKKVEDGEEGERVST